MPATKELVAHNRTIRQIKNFIGADELIYQDTVASLYERNSLKSIISKTVKDIFIPITVGGGPS